jgi:hypothetical protein
MKWSRPLERLVVNLVRWHLRPGALFHQGPPTDRAVRRFYRSIGEDLPELILLVFGDFGATRGPGLLGDQRGVMEVHMIELLEGFRRYMEESLQRPKLLSGNDVMQLLSLAPGPIIGDLLNALEEAQDLKEVSDRPSAERFVEELYRQKYPS